MKLLKSIVLILTIGFMFITPGYGQTAGDKMNTSGTGLLIIDVQMFYFPGGALPLVNPEPAALKAKVLLEKFRELKLPVIHIKHNAKSGADIHPDVQPKDGEKVILKDYANSFRGTDLLEYLIQNRIKRLIICGMQTHMCVEAATRAAVDYGFECVVIEDACATRDLIFKNKIVKAEDVHYSTLSAIQGSYAKVMSLDEFLKNPGF